MSLNERKIRRVFFFYTKGLFWKQERKKIRKQTKRIHNKHTLLLGTWRKILCIGVCCCTCAFWWFDVLVLDKRDFSFQFATEKRNSCVFFLRNNILFLVYRYKKNDENKHNKPKHQTKQTEGSNQKTKRTTNRFCVQQIQEGIHGWRGEKGVFKRWFYFYLFAFVIY